MAPERIHVQVSHMPDGQRYFCIARTFTKDGYRYNAPKSYLSIGLGGPAHHGRDKV